MSDFSRALGIVLGHEGGYVSHEDDRGGATNRGVTQETYTHHRREQGLPPRPVEGITSDEVEAIYRGIWEDASCEEWGWPLNLVVFDAAVNHGTKRAVRMLQDVSGARVDGIVGPETRNRVHNHAPEYLARALLWRRARYYADIVKNDPSQAVFFAGWVERVKGLADYAA